MLAQNFKTAADLGIQEEEISVLITVLGMLERGEIKHVRDDKDLAFLFCRGERFTGHFNMKSWNFQHECDTVCCIGGTAELLLGKRISRESKSQPGFHNLCYPIIDNYNDVTVAQAAVALRNYLTTGNARWSEAIGE